MRLVLTFALGQVLFSTLSSPQGDEDGKEEGVGGGGKDDDDEMTTTTTMMTTMTASTMTMMMIMMTVKVVVETETEADRQTDKQRQTNRQTERQTDIDIHTNHLYHPSIYTVQEGEGGMAAGGRRDPHQRLLLPWLLPAGQ